jgi:hypothetical protein
MAGIQRLLAIAMTFFLAGNPGGGNADALGIVVLADHASSGSLAAAEGTTIYDGDRLSTDAGGALRLQVGEAFLSLAEQSCVMVHKGGSGAEKEFEVELVSGTVVLSVAKGTDAEIVASGARVRPLGAPRGVAQVRLVKPLEIVVFARKGPAAISYHGESETVEEGRSVRVLLNPDEDGGPDVQGAKHSGRRGKAFAIVAVGAATAAGIVLLSRGGNGGKSVESPDHP